ncbi:MAG: DUF4012 domain-containing protein [bacterium]|nr:DUF4012 domain-containing protein [bacterium]
MPILKNKKPMFDIIPTVKREEFKIEAKPNQPEAESNLEDLVDQILEDDLGVEARRDVEATLNDWKEGLTNLGDIGIQLVSSSKISKPRYKPILNKYQAQNIKYDREIKQAIDKIREPISPRVVRSISSYKPVLGNLTLQSKSRPVMLRPVVSNNEAKARIIEEEVIAFYKNEPIVKTAQPLNFAEPIKKRRIKLWFISFIVVGVSIYGFTLKNELLDGGSLAFNSLEEAGESFKNFNFAKAADGFDNAYQDFSKVSQTMNFIGAGLAGIFSELPGFDTLTAGGADKIVAAKNLIEAGKLIAQAGQAMAEAVDSLSQTGLILNPADAGRIKPLKIVNSLKNALLLSEKNLQKAKALISNIDASILPDDKEQKFNDFKDKVPLLEEYLGHAIQYADFLEGIIGIDEPKKYLLLFENSSELRPTGGFPGTYGVVSFSSGGLSDFFVNDVYNLDGQLKENIIPPKQLQHITPTWGMRDSAWFADFPTSAEKAMSFFVEEAGYKVDGVIVINPDIVSNILKIVGPVEMPEYGLNLTADNFLESIQEEVEYGDNRIQPKKVVLDFGPRFLEKLYSANSEKWTNIFNVLMTGLEEKDILLYFSKEELENFTINEGFGGEIKDPSTSSGQASDYLMINLSNIKGSKTDAVTDSSIEVDNRFEDGQVIHKVTITRNHKGGDHEHGFYNRQNPAYVRVLISENGEFLSISGNDTTNFKPLMNYSLQGDFEKDRDLTIFESSFHSEDLPNMQGGFSKIDRFDESGKEGLGFWMITEPGETKTVEFEYSVPFDEDDYSFYFQKQPGLDWKNLVYKVTEPGYFDIKEITPTMNKIGETYVFDEILKKDFSAKIKFK